MIFHLIISVIIPLKILFYLLWLQFILVTKCFITTTSSVIMVWTGSQCFIARLMSSIYLKVSWLDVMPCIFYKRRNLNYMYCRFPRRVMNHCLHLTFHNTSFKKAIWKVAPVVWVFATYFCDMTIKLFLLSTLKKINQ